MEANELFRELGDEKDGVRKAGRAVDVEGRRAPSGRVAADGDRGRHSQKPWLVLLGVVDELHEFLPGADGNGNSLRECKQTVRLQRQQPPQLRLLQRRWQICGWLMAARYTWVAQVGPTAQSDSLKKVTEKPFMFMSAGWLLPPSLPDAMSPVISRERTVRRFSAPI